jgi:RNA polymerase sigma-70 factor, ECF subfamily
MTNIRPSHTRDGEDMRRAAPCNARQPGYFSGSERRALTILLRDKATARALLYPHVNAGHKTMSENDTRVSVIVGVCRRDPERWSEFDSIYRPMLLTFLLKRGLDDSSASDVVQEVFVKLLGKIDTYDRARCKFRTWLFGLAKNTMIDHARRRGAYKKAVDGWAVQMLHASPSDSAKMAEEWDRFHRQKILQHALTEVRGRTSPRVWYCFEQRLLRDRPGALIAAELGLEPNAVFANSCRVLKKIRAVCQEFDEDLTDDDDSSLPGRD